MKRYIVLEADTELSSVFVYEAIEVADNVLKRSDEWLFNEFQGPRLYGKIEPFLITKETIRNAKPIEPEIPKTAEVHHV